MVHVLKVHPEQLRLLALQLKRFEFRKDDRSPAFAAGDELLEYGWDPKLQERTGEWLRLRVTHVSRGGEFGVPEGFAVLSVVLAATMQELRPIPFGQLPTPEDFGRPGEPPPRPEREDDRWNLIRDHVPPEPTRLVVPSAGPSFRENRVRSFGDAPVEIEAVRLDSDACGLRAVFTPAQVAGASLVVYAGVVPDPARVIRGTDPAWEQLVEVEDLHLPGGIDLSPNGLQLISSIRVFVLEAAGTPTFLRVYSKSGEVLLQATCGVGNDVDVGLFLTSPPDCRVPAGAAWPAGTRLKFAPHRISLQGA